MDIFIDDKTKQVSNLDEISILIEKVIAETLRQENFKNEVEVSIIIVDADEIAKINKEFRNIDKATDVLSFPQFDFTNKAEIENIKKQSEINLGDIVICYDKVLSQAKEYGHSIDREFGFLVAHSMLHLLGYDHFDDKDDDVDGKIMFEKQEIILSKIGLTR